MDTEEPGTASNKHFVSQGTLYSSARVTWKDTPQTVSGPVGLSNSLRPCQLLMLSPAPGLSLSPSGHSSNIREFGPEQRGKKTNRFLNTLSTTQTQQGQNEWRHRHFIKVKVPETLAESRAALHKRSPGLAPHQVGSPLQGVAMTGRCHHELVSQSPSSREPSLDRPPAQRGSGAWGCPPGRCPSRPSPGWVAADRGVWQVPSCSSITGPAAGLDSPAPSPRQYLGFPGTAKCPQCPRDLCAKTGHRRRTR